MSHRRPALAAVGALAAGLLTGGCSAHYNLTVPSPSVKAAPLTVQSKAWTAQPGRLWDAAPASTTPWAWTTATSVIVPQEQALTGYAAADGTKQWTLRLPRKVCSIAAAPNRAGIGAVLMGTGTTVNDEACNLAGAVDTTTGRLLWTKSLTGLSEYGLTDVAIGDTAVAITNPCDTAVTLSVKDGSRLAKLPAQPDPDGCNHSFASDGTTVVDGTRDIAGALVGYDAATGRKLWSVPAKADSVHRSPTVRVHRVISSDPMVVDAQVNGHDFLRTIDPKTATMHLFGREGSTSWVPALAHAAGSQVVIQYGQSQVLFTYDGRSGREVKHTVLDDGESAVGVRGAQVISAVAPGPTLGTAGMAVVSTDPVTGKRTVLGVISLEGVAATLGQGLGYHIAISGDTMVVSTIDGLVGYKLPNTGKSIESLPDPRKWATGDLRPAQATDLCATLSTATKQALGFATPSLPAPADCRWFEEIGAIQSRQVWVSSSAIEPSGSQSAIERARLRVKTMTAPNSTSKLPAMTAVPGIGDEAWMSSRDSALDPLVTMIVRVANVVITINAISDGAKQHTAELGVLQRGARLVAADMIAEVNRRR